MQKLLVKHSDIRDAFARLMRTADNAQLYALLSSARCVSDISADTQCLLAPGYRLVRVDHRIRPGSDEFEIALLNDVEHSVVYYNKVLISKINDLNCRHATQNMVWRSANAQHSVVLRDVAQKVIFSYILERYDVILSDNQQAGEGKFFWQRQMSNAISFGLHVYYYQILSAQLQPILTQGELNNLEDQLWSEEDDQQYHFALISRVQLAAELLVDAPN